MRIEVMDRYQAETRSEIEKHEDKVIISIYTPNDTPANIDKSNPTVLDVLPLAFVDCDDSDKGGYPIDWIFSNQMAYKVFQFVEKWKDKVDVIWVHCDGGVSRSAGLAAALLKAYTNDDTKIFDNLEYCPNMLVYRRTLNVLNWEMDKK